MESTSNALNKYRMGTKGEKEGVKMANIASSSRSCFFVGQYVVRALSLGLCLGAFFVMLKSDQTFFSRTGHPSHARYTYYVAYKFLAIADIVVCSFSFVSLLYVFLLSCYQKPKPNFYFMLFLHDLAMSLMMMAGCAAGTALGYVDHYGQSKSGWYFICDRATKFCNKITISVVLSYLGLICYLLLNFLAVLKIKSSTKVN